MIDLVSTRDNIDIQSKRCAQLLAAVIGQAIKDAAAKPGDEERKKRRNSRHAYKAIKFLFEKHGVFDVYAHLIGMSGQDIRKALLSRRPLNPKQKAIFSNDERRIIQIRYLWYKADQSPLKPSDLNYREYEDKDDQDGTTTGGHWAVPGQVSVTPTVPKGMHFLHEALKPTT